MLQKKMLAPAEKDSSRCHVLCCCSKVPLQLRMRCAQLIKAIQVLFSIGGGVCPSLRICMCLWSSWLRLWRTAERQLLCLSTFFLLSCSFSFQSRVLFYRKFKLPLPLYAYFLQVPAISTSRLISGHRYFGLPRFLSTFTVSCLDYLSCPFSSIHHETYHCTEER